MVNVLLYYKTWLTIVYLLRQCEVFACSIDLRSVTLFSFIDTKRALWWAHAPALLDVKNTRLKWESAIIHNHNREWYGFWLWTCAFCFQRNIYFSFNYQTQKEMKKSIDCLRPPPGFVFLALCDWSRKIAPPSESVILKSWSSSRLGHLSFPCFKQFACSYSEFSLANHNFHLCFNWSQLLLWI